MNLPINLKKSLLIICSLITLICISSISGLYIEGGNDLPDEIVSGKNVSFTIKVGGISGDLQVMTDLENPKFDTTAKNVEKLNNKIIIKGVKSTEITISGSVPKGYEDITVKDADGRPIPLKIRIFDKDPTGNYYYIQDNTESKAKPYTIIIPDLENVKNEINGLKYNDTKELLYKYLNIGLYYYVKNDLIPMFKKYEPNRGLGYSLEEMENKVKDLEFQRNILIAAIIASILIFGGSGYYFGRSQIKQDANERMEKAYKRGKDDGKSGKTEPTKRRLKDLLYN